jgi:hypothetical protein
LQASLITMAEATATHDEVLDGDAPSSSNCLVQCLKSCYDSYYYFFFGARSKYGNIEACLKQLYAEDLTRKDLKGRTPLHYMCLDNRVLTIKLLLVDHHISTNIDAKDIQGRTPLHYACRNGYEECAATLIKLGADATTKDNYGRTPLDAARFNGRKELLDSLRGNVRPGLMSPSVATRGGSMSPSKPIRALDLKKDLPPEETVYGVQMDDLFIPSSALRATKQWKTKVKDPNQMKAASSTSVFTASALEIKGANA